MSTTTPTPPSAATDFDSLQEDEVATPRALSLSGFEAPGQAQSLNTDPAIGTLLSTTLDNFAGGSLSESSNHETVSGLTPIVDDVLYLGSAKDVGDAAACVTLGIGAYLCVAKRVAFPAHAVASGVPTLRLPMRDAADECLKEHMYAAIAFIDEQAAAGRRVALFCQQGRSRSASIAMAYVMQQRGVSGAQALEIVQQRYPRADPNFSFLQQMGCLST